MSMTIPVTESNLYDFFKTIKGVETIEIETLTIPETIKGCPYDFCKVTKRRVKVGASLSLQSEVEANQAAEGHMPHYPLAPRTWGNKIKGTPLIEHNEEIYLPCIVESNISVCYIDNTTGNNISFVDITPWIKKTKEPKKQAGIVKKAIYRNYNINAIMSVNLLDKESTTLLVK